MVMPGSSASDVAVYEQSLLVVGAADGLVVVHQPTRDGDAADRFDVDIDLADAPARLPSFRAASIQPGEVGIELRALRFQTTQFAGEPRGPLVLLGIAGWLCGFTSAHPFPGVTRRTIRRHPFPRHVGAGSEQQ